MITTPRTRNQTLTEIESLKERLRGVKADHSAAVAGCKDAHQSTGGYARAAKCAEEANKNHDDAVAAMNLQKRMVCKSELGAALLHAVDTCEAVQAIAGTHETAKEAHEAIASQLYNIASIHEREAALPSAQGLDTAKKLADRKLKSAQRREQDLTLDRDGAYQTMRAIKEAIAALEQPGAAPLALTNGTAAAGSGLRGFSPRAPPDDSGEEDDDDGGGGAAAAAATGPMPALESRKRSRGSPPATEPKNAAQIDDLSST
jgi:tetratricopeptide (TPR) repeat protein